MTYGIMLYNKKYEAYWFLDSLLDGIIDKDHLLHTRVDFVESLGFCKKCHGAIAHVISNDIDVNGPTNKFCPVLFHDLVQPSWKLKEVVQ